MRSAYLLDQLCLLVVRHQRLSDPKGNAAFVERLVRCDVHPRFVPDAQEQQSSFRTVDRDLPDQLVCVPTDHQQHVRTTSTAPHPACTHSAHAESHQSTAHKALLGWGKCQSPSPVAAAVAGSISPELPAPNRSDYQSAFGHAHTHSAALQRFDCRPHYLQVHHIQSRCRRAGHVLDPQLPVLRPLPDQPQPRHFAAARVSRRQSDLSVRPSTHPMLEGIRW